MEKSLKINIPEGYEIDTEKSTFAEIVFKPIDSLETWEDCIKKLNNTIKEYYWINSYSKVSVIHGPILSLNSSQYNILPSEEDAKKFLTLQKLWTCRKAYIDNWEPDWTNGNTEKYVIRVVIDKFDITSYSGLRSSFSFPTLEMAKEFLKNFKPDLEFVKDLL
jgi:hypothetical protein